MSWSHFVQLLAIEKTVKREFYISLAQQEGWSTRTMAQRIDGQLFERTLIAKKPEDMIFLELKKLRENGLYNQELLLKDPYLLDFLELNDHYLEKDLEDAILREIEKFILELGAGFTFVERQKRITVDDDDFYMDLLFYNRNLRRLISFVEITNKRDGYFDICFPSWLLSLLGLILQTAYQADGPLLLSGLKHGGRFLQHDKVQSTEIK